jgi:uncharacterized protein (TIGR02246 family)
MRLLANVCMASLIAAGVSAQPATLYVEFSRLEEVWNTAHRNADADALAALWADDLEVVVPRMPPMSKADALAFARTARMRFERYETSQIRVRTYGDTAVVTGRLQRTRSLAGKQTTDDWRFTKVYVRHDAMWRVVSFHASDSSASP